MRKSRYAAAFAVVVAAAGCTFGADATTTIASASGEIAEAALPTARCGDFFIAEATLNGRGPFRLLLDTGYPRTQLTPAVAEALGVRRSLDSIEVGALRVRGRIPVGVRDLAALGIALRAEIDGILGYTVFEGVLLTYDFPDSAVRVREGALAKGAPGIVPMTRGERPFISADLGARTVNLLLDTGFSGGVSLGDFADLAFEEPARPVGAHVRVDGVSLRHGGRLTDDLAFGAFTLEQPVVTSAAGRNLLGQDVLRHFAVTFDRASGRAQFLPADGTGRLVIELPPLRGTGLVLVPRSGHLGVADVLERSPAQAAGLMRGDRIVAVDGVPISERGCPAPGGEEIAAETVLTIERDGGRRDVVVTHAVLVR